MKSLLECKMNICYIVLLLSIGACSHGEKDEFNIIGHWHLKDADIKVEDYYHRLDVVNDNTLYIDEWQFLYFREADKVESKSELKDKIIMVADGIHDEYDYVLTRDTLTLYNEIGKLKYIGVRKSIESCDKMVDFNSNHLVRLDFPIQENEGRPKEIKGMYNSIFNFGVNKTTNKKAIELNDRILKDNKIGIEFDKFLSKIYPDVHDEINLIVNIDKDYNNDHVVAFIKELHFTKFRGMYQHKVNENGEIVVVEYEMSEPD